MISAESRMPPKAKGRSNHFQTPAGEVERLFPFLPKDWTVWENACGAGQMVASLQGGGYKTVGTDILSGFDFLSPLCPPDFQYDCIITNPPYTLKDEWLARCYELRKPFALLLPATAIGEQERVRMYKKHGISLALPPRRINFGTPSGKKGKSWFYAAWFCWGIELPSQIHVLD